MKDIYDFAYPSRAAVLNAHKRNRNALSLGDSIRRDTVVAFKRYSDGGGFPAQAFAPEKLEWEPDEHRSSTQDR